MESHNAALEMYNYSLGDGFPFGQTESSQPDTPHFDSNLRIKLLDLPITAWEPQESGVPCINQSGNLVSNCTFTSNGSGWNIISTDGGSAYASYSNQELRVNILQAGSEYQHIQAVTPLSIPSSDNYILTFQARSQGNRSMIIRLRHDGSDDGSWESYYQQKIEVKNNMKLFTLFLPKIPADSNARLEFHVGNNGLKDVFIDEIYLGPN